QAGGAPLVARGAAAEDLEAHDLLGPGVVGYVEPRLHLDHETPCETKRTLAQTKVGPMEQEPWSAIARLGCRVSRGVFNPSSAGWGAIAQVEDNSWHPVTGKRSELGRGLHPRRLALAGERLLGARPHDADDPPPLELGQRASLHDLNQVAQVRLVG